MSQKLYVGNLSYSTTETTLRTMFAEFGEIVSVNLIMDRDTGRPKGFAFVEMAAEQDANKAVSALNGKTVDDRQIKVEKAQPKTDDGRRDFRSSGGRRPRW